MAQLDPLILGHSFMDAGDPEAALKAFYRAGAEQGLTAEILSGLGSANLALGRLGQAEKLLRTAVEEDPKFTAAWNNLGVVLANRQIWGEAREVFRLAFALSNGESTEIRDNLALAEDKFEEIPTISDPNAKFRLVRQGNGRYLLTGT